MEILRGTPITEGIAIAKLRILRDRTHTDRTYAHLPIDEAKRRYADLCNRVSEQFQELAEHASREIGRAEGDIFATQGMMVQDEDLQDEVYAALGEGMTLSDAIESAGKVLSARFLAMEDEYLRARAADVTEVCRRLCWADAGDGEQSMEYDTPTVLAADDLSPAQLLRADRTRLSGFFTAGGSANSHTAILARSLDLPSAVAVGNLPDLAQEGEVVIIDGFTGEIVLSPDDKTVAYYRRKQEEYQSERQADEAYRGQPTQTAHGRRLKLLCNVGSVEEVGAVLSADGEGIGLFRSEFLYLESRDYPTEEVQFALYRRLLSAMVDRPVTVRTMDVGADKQADYFALPPEENPALGYRSIRICMDRPEILRTQLRALYRASVYGQLSILIPMISAREELVFVKDLAQSVRDALDQEGIPYDRAVPIGIMIETPAAALIAHELADMADFFSIGTNDLTQYTLAADRQNPLVARNYRTDHPAVLRLIRKTVEAAHSKGITVSICGEAARDPRLLPQFLEMDIDGFSVAPPYVLRLRRAIAGN